MNYYIIPASLIIAFVLILMLSMFSKRPFAGLGLFFLIIFLATWAGQLWITPFGPVTWGISWIPLLVVSVFFLFFILAFIPPVSLNEESEESALMVMGTFFWVIIVLLLISIALGYYKS